MIDPFDKGTIDIFAEEFWHQQIDQKDRKKYSRKKNLFNQSREEQRAYFKQKAEDLRIILTSNNWRARLVLLKRWKISL